LNKRSKFLVLLLFWIVLISFWTQKLPFLVARNNVCNWS